MIKPFVVDADLFFSFDQIRYLQLNLMLNVVTFKYENQLLYKPDLLGEMNRVLFKIKVRNCIQMIFQIVRKINYLFMKNG